MPLGRARRTPTGRATALTRVHTRGAKVAPVVRLHTRRRRWLLADDDRQPLAELAEDRVTAHTMGRGTEATHWREIEVELTEHGSPELLDRIEKQLLKAGARRSGSDNKLSRVLADRLPAGRPQHDAGPPRSAAAAVLSYLRTQADTLRRYDPLVRQDAPDSVHKMRVSSRRMRSALQAYRRVLDRDATRPLTDELKWLAAELAPARDTEVMAGRFSELVDEQPAELVLGPVAATLDRTFARQQVQARERALAALDSDRYLALQDAIDALLADPPLTDRADRPARRELTKNVRRAYRRLRRRMADVDEQPAGDAPGPGAARGAQGGQAAALRGRGRRARGGQAGQAAAQAAQADAERARRPPGRRGGQAGAARARRPGAPGGRQRLHLRAAARHRVRPRRARRAPPP